MPLGFRKGWRYPYPGYYPMLPSPVYYVDPIGPAQDVKKAEAERRKLEAERKALEAERRRLTVERKKRNREERARRRVEKFKRRLARLEARGEKSGRRWERASAKLAKAQRATGMGVSFPYGLAPPRTYVDVMGPGARDADVGREAKWYEVVDEAIPAREALAMRRAMGLGDTGGGGAAAPVLKGTLAALAGVWLGWRGSEYLRDRFS